MDANSKSNIVLIGMPGAGKSTLGVVLAKLMQFDFVDADLLIQRRFGSSLSDLIEKKGSAGFIECEAEVLKDLQAVRTVISTGGSAVYSDEAMDHLHRIGHVVYLKVEEDDLQQRLGNLMERGVVLRSGVSMSLADLFRERTPLYEKHGEYTVSTSGIGINDAAYKVADLLAPIMSDDSVASDGSAVPQAIGPMAI